MNAGHRQGAGDQHVGDLCGLALQGDGLGKRCTGAAGRLGDWIVGEQVYRAADTKSIFDRLQGLLQADIQTLVLLQIRLHQGGERVNNRSRCRGRQLDVKRQAGGDIGAARGHDLGGRGQQ